ncbi:MAG: hypothetical protein FWF80_04750, partial [Defluviitaleaceae bacterium]|nr:hypothetical protein [Defluviitaleaceae bacterium]
PEPQSTSIESAVVDINSVHTYSGSAQYPTFTVTLDGTELINGVDFTHTASSNTNVGNATLSITGIGNFHGTTSRTFAIERAAQTTPLTPSNPITIQYGDVIQLNIVGGNGNGELVFASNSPGVASVGNTGLVSAVGVGTAGITVYRTGGSNHLSSTPITFAINVTPPDPTTTSIGPAAVNVTSAHVYNGSAQNPTFTVTLNGTVLVQDVDFTHTVSNNTNAGNAAISITGIGDFHGTISSTFNIDRATQSTPLTPSDAITIGYGASVQLNIVGGNGNGDLVFESGQTNVVSVSSTGLITAAGMGSANISVYRAGGTNHLDSAPITIPITVLRRINVQTIEPDALTPIDPEQPVTVTVSPENALAGYDINDIINLPPGLRMVGDVGAQRIEYYDFTQRFDSSDGVITSNDVNSVVTGNVSVIDGFEAARAIPVSQDNIERFNAFANTDIGLSRHFELTSHVSLAGINWTPIGDTFSGFVGSFNGNEWNITDLNSINTAGRDNHGLFGVIGGGGLVENVGLLNVDINTNGASVGGIAGVNHGTVRFTYVRGRVQSSSPVGNVGGIAGTNHGTVRDAFTLNVQPGTVDIRGFAHVGGIVGYSTGSVQTTYSTANIWGGGPVGNNSGTTVTGGIVGRGTVVTNSISLNDGLVGGGQSGTPNARRIGTISGGGFNHATSIQIYDINPGGQTRPAAPQDVGNPASVDGRTILASDNIYSLLTAKGFIGADPWWNVPGRVPLINPTAAALDLDDLLDEEYPADDIPVYPDLPPAKEDDDEEYDGEYDGDDEGDDGDDGDGDDGYEDDGEADDADEYYQPEDPSDSDGNNYEEADDTDPPNTDVDYSSDYGIPIEDTLEDGIWKTRLNLRF